MNTEQKIQQLLNKELMYGMKLITIIGYDIDHDRERVYLHTNYQQSHFDRPLDAIDGLLREFKPVTRANVPAVNGSDVLMQTIASADDLKAILMDSIQKVKADAGYAKQATVINNQVNSIVNITKMQLDYAKAANRMNKD